MAYIGHIDSEDLCEFVDFLSSVESAMPYVQGLQALNDFVWKTLEQKSHYVPR